MEDNFNSILNKLTPQYQKKGEIIMFLIDPQGKQIQIQEGKRLS